MKKILNFELPLRFCVWYHKIIMLLHLVTGVVFIMWSCIQEKGVSQGIMLGIATLVGGTICFLMLPLALLAFSLFTRFLPILSIPVYIILLIGSLFGESNDVSYPLVWIFGSMWGWFNIRTAIIANRDDNFSITTIIPEG